MKNLTEFSDSNCELQEEEMKHVNGGDGLADLGLGVLVGSTAGAAGGFYWDGWETGTGLDGFDPK